MSSCLCATKYTQIDILISYYNQVKGEEEEDEALELKETTIKGQRWVDRAPFRGNEQMQTQTQKLPNDAISYFAHSSCLFAYQRLLLEQWGFFFFLSTFGMQ